MRWLDSILARCACAAAALLIAAAVGPGRAQAGSASALVPAYFYPSGDAGTPGTGNYFWSQLNTAAGKVPIAAILNPATGPGTAADPNYVAAVANLRAAGGNVYGYVATAYGSRDITQVKRDINKYKNFYNINGIFLDQMSNADADLGYYQTVYNYIKTKLGASCTVVGNPGTPFISSSYLSAADILVIFEGPLTNSDPNGPSFTNYPYGLSWFLDYPAGRFANIVYDVPTAAAMRSVVSQAVADNAGSVYATDGVPPNPYGDLPLYWRKEVSAIRTAGGTSGLVPAAWCGAVVGAVVTGRRWRKARVSTLPTAAGPR
jgi:hypothetical protein